MDTTIIEEELEQEPIPQINKKKKARDWYIIEHGLEEEELSN